MSSASTSLSKIRVIGLIKTMWTFFSPTLVFFFLHFISFCGVGKLPPPLHSPERMNLLWLNMMDCFGGGNGCFHLVGKKNGVRKQWKFIKHRIKTQSSEERMILRKGQKCWIQAEFCSCSAECSCIFSSKVPGTFSPQYFFYLGLKGSCSPVPGWLNKSCRCRSYTYRSSKVYLNTHTYFKWVKSHR